MYIYLFRKIDYMIQEISFVYVGTFEVTKLRRKSNIQ